MGALRRPVLGIILTGAALHGANVRTTFLLLAYGLGAATRLRWPCWSADACSRR